LPNSLIEESNYVTIFVAVVINSGSNIEGISSFIITGFSQTFTALLIYIFNLSVTSETLPSFCKEAVVVSVLKKGSSTIISNYRSICLLNTFSKVFAYIFFKHKLNPSQHGFYKLSTTSANLVTYTNILLH
jgi:hypothetical protein